MKKFGIAGEDLVELIPPMGGAIATDRIVVDGALVGWMYREEGINDLDSGWRFFAGDEAPDYLDKAENRDVYAVNTIANYDPAIIPYLNMPSGTKLERDFETHEYYIVTD